MKLTPDAIRKIIREGKDTMNLIPDGKILLVENFLFTNTDIVNESRTYVSKDLKNYEVVGKLQEAEAVNQNNRFYPKHVLLDQIEKYMNLVRQRRAMGVLDHPDHTVINLDRLSHIVTDIWWEGNKVLGKVEFLNTPCGEILIEMDRKGIPVGMSSRGVGTVEEKAGKIYVSDYELICFDAVSDPSTRNAFVTSGGLINEHKKLEVEKTLLQEILEGMK